MQCIFVDLVLVAIFMLANLPHQCVCGSTAQKFSRRQGQKANQGYTQIVGTSAAGCTSACGSDDTCEAVSYHAHDGVCLLSEHNPDDESGNDKYSNDGAWTMYKKHCGALSSPTNGKVDLSSGSTQGRTATYLCNNGYLLEGEATITCPASGNWPTAPTCAAKLGGSCDIASECSALFSNSECSSNKCTCVAGYVATSDNASCIIKDCGEASSPTNGKVNVSSGKKQGQTATFSCNNGYLLEGDATVACPASGDWPTAPTCEAKLGGTCATSSDCTVLFSNSGCSWNNLCACVFGYVATGNNTSCRTAQCFAPWRKESGSCYYTPLNKANWSDAEALCVELGGHLQSIRSLADNRVSAINFRWIGLHDMDKDGNFEWTSGETRPFNRWHEGQPRRLGNRDCVYVYYKHWSTSHCSLKRRFVCKKNLS